MSLQRLDKNWKIRSHTLKLQPWSKAINCYNRCNSFQNICSSFILVHLTSLAYLHYIQNIVYVTTLFGVDIKSQLSLISSSPPHCLHADWQRQYRKSHLYFYWVLLKGRTAKTFVWSKITPTGRGLCQTSMTMKGKHLQLRKKVWFSIGNTVCVRLYCDSEGNDGTMWSHTWKTYLRERPCSHVRARVGDNVYNLIDGRYL